MVNCSYIFAYDHKPSVDNFVMFDFFFYCATVPQFSGNALQSLIFHWVTKKGNPYQRLPELKLQNMPLKYANHVKY